jgi:hypothetical protein
MQSDTANGRTEAGPLPTESPHTDSDDSDTTTNVVPNRGDPPWWQTAKSVVHSVVITPPDRVPGGGKLWGIECSQNDLQWRHAKSRREAYRIAQHHLMHLYVSEDPCEDTSTAPRSIQPLPPSCGPVERSHITPLTTESSDTVSHG